MLRVSEGQVKTEQEDAARPSTGESAYLGVGTNLGDREATLAAVIDRLHAEPDLELRAASSVFETAPVGPQDQGAYLNAAVVVATGLSPHALLARLQAIEAGLGRDRRRESVRWGPREIDLDLLFFGARVLVSEDLILPHPRAHERSFVLTPLAQLAPELVHPVLGTRIADLAAARFDPGAIRECPRPQGWPDRFGNIA